MTIPVFIAPLPLRVYAQQPIRTSKTRMVVPATPSHSRPSSHSPVASVASVPQNPPNESMSSVVQIYDTTLRDGAQGEGISLSVADKLKIAARLDEMGVHYIEGGWPGSNPKDEAFFAECKSLKHSQLVAFGSTRHKSATCETDHNVQALVVSNTPVVTLVGKTWNMQVTVVLGATLEENLSMIADTVRYFKQLGREVMLDAEHFFDGFEASPLYAMACLTTAVDAGADVVVLCDTNGGTLPWRIGEVTHIVVNRFPQIRVGVHCHNDMELAVANSVSAVHAGATMVQGTINGYGERTGNANLMSIIPALQLKMGCRVVGEKLQNLTRLSRFVEEVANQPHVTSRPFVGASSFAHKGGLHVAAVMKNPDTYQHIDPAAVGNECRILVSELSGRRNILSKARELGLLPGDDSESPQDEWSRRSKVVLDQVKDLENQGYSFEGAEASLELMLRRAVEGYKPPFELLDFSVNTDNKRLHYGEGPDAVPTNRSVTLATVKLALLGPSGMEDVCPTKICLEVAEGNGPVDAVNAALEKALFPVYPPLRSVSLVDYKVRILDNQSKTKATTRVMVEFADSKTGRQWTTMYAHPNIIVASINALMDGFEIAMWGAMPQCIR